MSADIPAQHVEALREWHNPRCAHISPKLQLTNLGHVSHKHQRTKLVPRTHAHFSLPLINFRRVPLQLGVTASSAASWRLPLPSLHFRGDYSLDTYYSLNHFQWNNPGGIGAVHEAVGAQANPFIYMLETRTGLFQVVCAQ
jgi:hypothetical protein